MDALVWALTELSDDYEQEIIFEHSEIRPISPELEEIERQIDRLKPWVM
jgi:uncharacterized protein Yka (UPF0111/DUF47 family)